MGIYKYYTEMPTWAKGVTIVALLGGSYLGYREIKKGVEKRKQKVAGEQYLKKIQEDIDKLEQTQPHTKIETNYRQLADSLYIALNEYNTDERAVYRTFLQMNNTTDVLKLIKAFGIRTKTGGLYNENFSLNAFITDAMNSEEIAEINKILAGKKIKYYF